MRSNLLYAAKAQQAPPIAPAQAAAIPAAVSFVQAVGHSAAGSGSTFLLARGLADHTTEGVLAPHVLADIGITTMVDLADSFADEGGGEGCRTVSSPERAGPSRPGLDAVQEARAIPGTPQDCTRS